MCQSMVNIQSLTAEIRRGKRDRKKETTREKYNVRICYAGWPMTIITKHVMQPILPAEYEYLRWDIHYYENTNDLRHCALRYATTKWQVINSLNYNTWPESATDQYANQVDCSVVPDIQKWIDRCGHWGVLSNIMHVLQWDRWSHHTSQIAKMRSWFI